MNEEFAAVDPIPILGERIKDMKANKSTGEFSLYDATGLSVLDCAASAPLPTDGPVRSLGPKYQCLNCRMRGSVVEVDGVGLWFRSFQRHVDREPATSTICCDCGRLSVPAAIHGVMPNCSQCHKRRAAPKKEATCFACNSRIHSSAVRVTVPVKPPFGFYSKPQLESFCQKCAKVANPLKEWDRVEIKRVMQNC